MARDSIWPSKRTDCDLLRSHFLCMPELPPYPCEISAAAVSAPPALAVSHSSLLFLSAAKTHLQ